MSRARASCALALAALSIGCGTNDGAELTYPNNDETLGAANAAHQQAWLSSTTKVAANPSETYEVRGSFRRPNTSGSAGLIYLAVKLFDSSGANIAGDGAWWFYPASAVSITDTNWHTYSGRFGAGTTRPLPAAARTMTVGAILNYDGTAAGNRAFEVTGLNLRSVNRTDIFTAAPTAGVTLSTANSFANYPGLSVTFTLDHESAVTSQYNVSGNAGSLATHLVTRILVDGVERPGARAITGNTVYWQNNGSWSEKLAAGSHTVLVQYRTPSNGSIDMGASDYMANSLQVVVHEP